MDFKSLLNQVTRPYWSPVHPLKYVKRQTVDGTLFITGWGTVYPQDVGAFNLMWLMSGCSGPPDSYARYDSCMQPVLNASFALIGNCYLKDLAAMLPLDKFSERVTDASNPSLPSTLFDALRLRV